MATFTFKPVLRIMIRSYEIHVNPKITAHLVANCAVKYQLCRAMLPLSGRRNVRNSRQRVFLACQLSRKDRPIDILRLLLLPAHLRPPIFSFSFSLFFSVSASTTTSIDIVVRCTNERTNVRTWILLLFTPSIVSFASRRKKTFEEQ